MEVLVRIADEKYLKHNLCGSLNEAIGMYYDECCLSEMLKYDC